MTPLGRHRAPGEDLREAGPPSSTSGMLASPRLLFGKGKDRFLEGRVSVMPELANPIGVFRAEHEDDER